MLNSYNGSLNCLLLYTKQYIIEKSKKRLYERYTANALGVLARFEAKYDDLLEEMENLEQKPKRKAENIKKDLLIRFNGGK